MHFAATLWAPTIALARPDMKEMVFHASFKAMIAVSEVNVLETQMRKRFPYRCRVDNEMC